MRILDYIPTGHKHAVTRQTLCSMTHSNDRDIRNAIAEVNANENSEELIINMNDGKGYFRPAKNEDNLVRIWMKIEASRQKSVQASVDAARNYLNRDKRKKPSESDLEKNQLSIEDWMRQMATKP